MKYRITAEFDLGTTIEPDLNRHSWDTGNVEDFEDGSYLNSGDVSVSGGSLSFTVEAEDEDAAEQIAHGVISEGMEVEDYEGRTWAVEGLSFSTEAEEMTKEDALVVVRRLLDRLAAEGTLSTEEREAFDVILQDV